MQCFLQYLGKYAFMKRATSAHVSLPSLTSPLKSYHCTTFLQNISANTRLYDVRPGKQPIWNSFETCPGWLNFDIENVFYIIVRYSMKLSSLLQYFFVLGKSIFLHFPSIWNQFIEIVSGRFEMTIKSSIYWFPISLFHLFDQ
ncbi:hypothetical protein T09_3195 [Trichinella sp. T9]|nr:hypothetical protein T09_3195 [Trichinella sp. T9]